MEDDFSVYENKPTRNENYFCNLRLKVKTEKILRKYGPEISQNKWKGWNFKKNTGYKPIWSCHGYGGNCGCSRHNQNEKIQAKRSIQSDVCQSLREYKSCAESD